ncbi:MAG TPA: hypothetical protein VFL14_06130 [Xanthomonadales bacterium]|nr:hypothetical protein [Xanthomonadales bacterium]
MDRQLQLRPALLALALAAALPAHAAETIGDAFREGKPTLDVRGRFESVDDEAFAKDATALTLRARLGFRTAPWRGFSAFAEAEGIQGAGEYNDTANGDTQFPTVADPDGEELNQLWVGWHAGERTSVVAGRQRFVLDNARWFGDAAFRQNQQTFDAISTSFAAGKATIRYAWLDDAHRVFGEDNPNPLLAKYDLNAHLVNASLPLGPVTAVGYAYFVENEDLPLTSTETYGVRASATHALGAPWTVSWSAEAAQQSDWKDGLPLDESYGWAEVVVGTPVARAKLGRERLGGDGVRAVQTPFASLHPFNGFADKFTVTPANGLVDAWAGLGGKLGPGEAAVVFHRFESDRGSTHYGDEWDVSWKWTPSPHHELEAKAAKYGADAFARDATKVWLAYTYRL